MDVECCQVVYVKGGVYGAVVLGGETNIPLVLFDLLERECGGHRIYRESSDNRN